ncbi:LacI family transcriptional regulator [Mesobacillus maritimus]|uniref:LacI family DNA-binding transcriptional regulator n=1 Tax=Mesobacillus maritimus TaxID=1643336 RepID=UPI00203F3FFD|nr:LacI family DNA-binding transcriptional regulator [Mesobacillus maritimus]MCM3584609.1 LacI family transcriptional regulator [Mesobacillus maritimus]MCM3671413.1 LacI family transcriptional regulator [Mesobacillus maritimus]
MAITIKDVAKKANVSIATVSRIINNKPGYSKETEIKVLEVIKELGYSPNSIARGLISKRTHTIGVLVPKLSSMLTNEIIRGIENITHQYGSSVIVCHTESNGQKTMQYLQLLHEKQVDGIIFASTSLTEEYYQFIENKGIPIVLLSTKSDQFPVPYVKVDDEVAAYTATEYLIKKGHRTIGMLSGNRDDRIAGKPRVDGFIKALKNYQLSVNEDHIVSFHGFSFHDGVNCFQQLIHQIPDVTAVFAASDEMALGMISAAYEMGIKVPEQISVIGYDNLSIAEMSIPPLTSVAQPLCEMGEAAAEMVFEVIENNQKVNSQICAHHIVERKSVRSL